MKILLLKHALFAMLLLLSFRISAQTTVDKRANQWDSAAKWLAGLNIKPHESVDQQELINQYNKNKALWEKTIAWLKERDLSNVPVGKYTIVPDSATVSVTEGPCKEFEATGWEAHQKFIDIQYIVKGKEKMGVAPVAAATLIKPYNEAKDVANYQAEGRYYISDPGSFFIFFPADAHRPTIKVEGYDTVKKIVVKIRYAG